MSTLAVNTITDEPGTGAVEFPLMPTVNGNAIIEQGSNANGRFVKYADGTMICTGQVDIVPVANVATSATFTYPATFSSVPTACATTLGLASTVTRNAQISDFPTTTSCQVNIIRTNTTATSNDVMVIGRWF
jgi:hypothetical protein